MKPTDGSPEAMYDAFSEDYDRFVSWDGRLAAEMPFIESQLAAQGASSVLDVACGTGMHAVALARDGYDVVGTDVSEGMIEQARANAGSAGIDVRFETAGFGAVSRVLSCSRPDDGRFDAALCLGNSLPHALSQADLTAALHDVARCLKTGGLLIIQNRNFDAVLAEHDRWMAPQYHRGKDSEQLFVRFYDFNPDGLLTFNVATLRRQADGEWQQHITSTKLWPMTEAELTGSLLAAGYEGLTLFGDLQGSPFDQEDSPNLVITAHSGG
ncbi:MAG: class I SAM-dependent methyltransferase [Anaerolineae bacterium]